MQTLFILKTGNTHPEILEIWDDFDAWIIAALGPINLPVVVREVHRNEPIPPIQDCAGIILTGSPAMVTDKHPWSVALEKWLPDVVAAGIPTLGICYGHQLLAEALGGRVDDHPNGKEMGTVGINCLEASQTDPLFRELPKTFMAHATHRQSALRLPPNAVLLASNDFEPHHAFRVGACAWGVQFHPEFNSMIMQTYIEHESQNLLIMGLDPAVLLSTIEDTPWAAQLLLRFATYLTEIQLS